MKQLFLSAGHLVVYNALAQLMNFAGTLVLASAYTPDEFGFLWVVLTLATIASVIGGLQAQVLISTATPDVYEKTKAVGMLVLVPTSILAAGGLVLIIPALATGNSPGVLSAASYVLCLALLLQSNSLVFGCLSFQRNYPSLGKFMVLRVFAVLVAQLLFGTTNVVDGLIVGLILGEFLARLSWGGIVSSAWSSLRTLGLRETIRFAFIERRTVTIAGSFTELFAVLTFLAPVAIIPIRFGEFLGGQYGLAHRLIWAPVFFVLQAFSPMLYREIAGVMKDHLKSRTRYLFVVLTISFASYVVIVRIFGPILDKLVDKEWSEFSQILTILAPWVAMYLGSVPARIMLRAFDLQSIQVVVDGMSFLGIVVCMFLVQESGYLIRTISLIGVAQSSVLAVIALYMFPKLLDRATRRVSAFG